MSKVTLKIGDKFSSARLFENLVITEFVDSKIYMSDGEYWHIPLRQDAYYVNDVKYAKEDIIVPTVSSVDNITVNISVNRKKIQSLINSEEFEPITRNNIAEVLEYNGISQGCYNLSKNCISYNWSSTNSVAGWSSTLYFDNPKWLEHLEVEFGKLNPLPKKSNPFDVVKVGQWVRCVSENIRTTKNKWYQRVLSTSRHDAFWYLDDTDVGAYSITTTHWDLTDIRDYNPDEEIVLNGKRYKLIE